MADTKRGPKKCKRKSKVYVKDSRRVVHSVDKKKYVTNVPHIVTVTEGAYPTFKKVQKIAGYRKVKSSKTFILKYRYPHNYHKIVAEGSIRQRTSLPARDLVFDEDGNPEYELVFRGKVYLLNHAFENDGKIYFGLGDNYEDFGSSLFHNKFIPIFEARKTNDPTKLELTNTELLFKTKKDSKGNKTRVLRVKARNGKLVYFSEYGYSSTGFVLIRNEASKIQLDTSLLSLPVVLAANTVRMCSRLVTYLPEKLGKYLVTRRNIAAKLLGYPLFAPAMTLQNTVDLSTTLFKAPVLLFTNKDCNRESMRWRAEWKKRWQKTRRNWFILTSGKKCKPEVQNRATFFHVGTMAELDAMRRKIGREGVPQPNEKL